MYNHLLGYKSIDSIDRSFLNETTGQVLREGDLFYRPVFAKTLYQIAEQGPNVLYNGTVGDQLVEDIQKKGGIISKEDLLSYQYDLSGSLLNSLILIDLNL